MRRRILVLAAVAVLLGAGSSAQDTSQRTRVILISFDGVADWIVDRLLASGKAPAFAALAREGAQADAMLTVTPTLTAVSHATFWTGAPPRIHGVTDNIMPRTPAAEGTLLDTQSGFLSGVLRAEPIWITAAGAGRDVLVVQATGGYPFAGSFPERLTQFDAYGERLLRGDVVELTPGVKETVFSIGDTAAQVRRDGSDGVLLQVRGVAASLSMNGRRLSPPLAVEVKGRRGYVHVLLLDVAASGHVLLGYGDVRVVRSTHPALADALVAEAGVPLGEIFGPAYQRGRLGRTIAEGGDGKAERRLSDAVLANHAYFAGAARFAAAHPWDLLVLYVPSMDTAGHALGGMLDPAMPGHDPALAARAWPVYEALFRHCVDDYVSTLRRLFPDATLIVGADHGMEGARRVWYPNAVLRDAGLLVERQSRPDLAHTKAVFLSGHGGGIHLNTRRYRSGIVAVEERDEVKRAVTRALMKARDPADGMPLVRTVVDVETEGEARGIGGEAAPDLYFDPAPGYEARAPFGMKSIAGDAPPTGTGVHGPFPERRGLHAIFYAAGPGVRPGTRPGIVRAEDVAPTVSRILGIPSPRDATGAPIPLD